MTRKNQRPNKAPCPACGLAHSWHEVPAHCMKALRRENESLKKLGSAVDAENLILIKATELWKGQVDHLESALKEIYESPGLRPHQYTEMAKKAIEELT